jgi:SNF2 family DNA or RNA helicase
MLVVPQHRALVLKASNPAQILACIPGAKPFPYKGADLLYVPHNIDAVRILRNLGAKAPGPINYYYKYPKAESQYDPFAHQRITSEFLTLNPKCAVLNAPRTGKTLSCLWAADYLMNEGLIRKVLIISPLSTLERVWNDAIFLTFFNRKALVLYGTAERRKKLMKQEADFYIINHDGFGIVAQDIPKDVDLIIYDEAAVLRNPSTRRFKQFQNFMATRPDARLWLLTGTPTPNEPTDAWALCKLLGAAVPRYSLFREQVMYKAGQWSWKPRPESEVTVQQVLQPSIRYSRDDCFDLPETIYETRQCELHPDQLKMYKKMLKELVTEVGKQQITAVNEAVKVQKLIQILLGVVYDSTGERAFVNCEPRVAVIREVIEECSEKVIVFVPFTGALDELADRLAKDFSVAVVNGSVSKSARDEIFRQFARPDGIRVLVADARTMSHGLDLSSATTIIWAAPTNSNETYEQANARIVGPRQKRKTAIVHIEATPLERRIYQRLKDKQSLQGLLLDAIQQQEIV